MDFDEILDQLNDLQNELIAIEAQLNPGSYNKIKYQADRPAPHRQGKPWQDTKLERILDEILEKYEDARFALGPNSASKISSEYLKDSKRLSNLLDTVNAHIKEHPKDEKAIKTMYSIKNTSDVINRYAKQAIDKSKELNKYTEKYDKLINDAKAAIDKYNETKSPADANIAKKKLLELQRKTKSDESIIEEIPEFESFLDKIKASIKKWYAKLPSPTNITPAEFARSTDILRRGW